MSVDGEFKKKCGDNSFLLSPSLQMSAKIICLAVLGQVVQQLGWMIHVYFERHYHLLVEMQEVSLAQGVCQFNVAYIQCYSHAMAYILKEIMWAALLYNHQNPDCS